MNALLPPTASFKDYTARLSGLLAAFDFSPVEKLAFDLRDCWKTGRQVFFIGNGGSGGNANHLANDFMYPLSKTPGSGLRSHSLAANPSIVSCIANDEGYDQVFSMQMSVLAHKDDVLVAFSGSGNSPNIVRALEEAKKIGLRSYAILGFSGGLAKDIADVAIHFEINDMQISEDAQLIVGHMIMQWLYAQRADFIPAKG